MLLKIKNDYAYNCRRLFEEIQKELSSSYSESLESGIGWYIDWFNKYYLKFPRSQKVLFSRQEFEAHSSDPVLPRLYKIWKRTQHRITGHEVPHKIRYRKIARYYLYNTRQQFLTSYLQELYEYQVAYLSQFESFILTLMDSIENLGDRTATTEEDVHRIREAALKRADKSIQELNRTSASYRESLHMEFRENLVAMAGHLTAIPGHYPRPERSKPPKYYSELAARNRDFHERWATTLTRITNKISLDILVVALRCRTEDSLEDFLLKTIQKVDSGISIAIRKLHSDLHALLKEDGSTDDQLQCEIDTSINVDEGVEQLRDHLMELSQSLPEELLVGDTDTQEMNIPVVRLINRILESRLIAPLQEFLTSENESLRNAGFRVNDLVNLTRFSLKNVDSETSDYQQVRRDILGKTIDSVGQEQALIETFKSSFEHEIDKLLADAFDPLSPEKIVKSSGELTDILREYAGQRVFSTVGRWRNTAAQFLEKRIIRLLYSKSEGLLLARRLKSRNVTATGNAPVLDLVQAVSPEKKVLQSLPRFYANLFSSRSSIGTEFYIEREEDEGRMRQAVGHYDDGYKGGILVLGERNAGKTAFCKQVTDKLFPKRNIVHIFAPDGGSTSVEDLARILEQETGLQGTPREILASLAHETVLVIHDLELWFARHEKGFEVVRHLARLMDEFNEKILFIVNSSPHSFSLIDAIEPIRSRFISTIELSPFSTEELKDMILLRHHSSGLHFRWKGRAENKMSELRLASLFDSFFTFTEGNPGAALNAWLGNILRRSGDAFEIRTPEIPNLSPLRKLDEDKLVLLAVFALHKRLTAAKLVRITGLEYLDVEKHLNALKRCGLVEERGRGILILNMYLEPFIIKVLNEKQVL